MMAAVAKTFTPAGREDLKERAERAWGVLDDWRRVGIRMGVPDALREIHRYQLWEILGHETFDDACKALWGKWRPRFDRDERQGLVAELTAEGWSTRAIGSALGVDQKTVNNDQKSVEEISSTDVITLDGKRRKRRQVDESEREQERERRRAADKAKAIKQQNIDLHVGFSVFKSLRHPDVLAEVQENYSPLASDITGDDLRSLGQFLIDLSTIWRRS